MEKSKYQQPNIKKKYLTDKPNKVPFITMFLANSGGLSSKRVCGILGWIVCLVLLILSFYLERKVDEFADYVLITSASLLGVDSLAGIFNKSNRN